MSVSPAASESRAITASTGLVVLLGDPVGHSLSPRLHNAAFGAQGLDLVYLAHAVAPEALADAVGGLWALGALGANVTIPHKQAVLGLAGSASATAQALGAANTLVRGDGAWHADNTDVAGFVEPLDAYRQRVARQPVVVLGAGGASRAVVYASLVELGASCVTVVARRTAQAEALADDLGAHGEIRVATFSDTSALRDAALVVNATPLGMGDGRSPLPDSSVLHDGQIVYDLVYRPARTPLLAAASANGAETIPGLPMLIGQAAASYRQWTGRAFPTDAARAALSDVAR